MYHVTRQCVCYRRHLAGTQSPERGQLPDPVAGRGRPAGGLPGDAPRGSLRGESTVDPGP